MEEERRLLMFGILHAHTVYSLNDSPQSPEELVLRAKELGYKNVTLTDHGTLLGIEEFLEAGEKHDMNAIPGIEAYLENREHFILVAKDEEGYKAIRKASREANKNIVTIRKIKYPCMTEETLIRFFSGNAHVIATSACISGPIARILLINHEKRKLLEKYAPYKEAAMRHAEAQKGYKAASQEIKALKKELKEAEKTGNTDRRSMIEREIEKVNGESQKWKKVRDSNASKAKKYASLPEITLAPEEELYAMAKAKAIHYRDIFPNFYLEVQYHGLATEAYVMPLIAKIAKEIGIPLIAANDAHITRKEDAEVRSMLRFNYFERHQGTSDTDLELYIKSAEELEAALLQVLPADAVRSALANTEILDECRVTIEHAHHYPSCQSDKTFDELIAEGKAAHMAEWDEEHEQRLKREVQVIKEMGYVDYHMIVRDYCNMMKKLGVIPKHELMNMPFDPRKVDAWLEKKQFKTGVGKGPGRGSAAGSLVCYLLGITELDPIKYGLLFDRYLNPERVSMPDIDTDVKTSLRPYIIRYLSQKYGADAVASIMTKNTYGAREAINASGRDRADELYQTLPKKEADIKKREYLYEHTRLLGKLVPDDPGATLNDIKTDTIRPGSEEEILLDRARKIEGKLFATGVHAGGVVITDGKDITEYLPVQWREDKGVWACEADMLQVEDRGLLKMDILGLNTLDCISDCEQMIEKYRGEVIDINKVPFEAEVFREIFASGRTNSVFQFESSGMKSMLRRFRPGSFEDLIILVAMFRPGPMQYIDDVIAVKQGQKPLTYLTPELEPILSKTYGAIVYQEQVMQIFQKLAGYSLGQADLVRRAMSKKKEEKLKQERDAFIYGDDDRNIEGCIKRGITREAADALFDSMLDFARYAFNKSHAACYALVAYQTAWLKYHYPNEFLCAMFNNKPVEKYGPLIEDCRALNIELLPPDINRSGSTFRLEDGKIRYGLTGIKGINDAAGLIIRLREGARTYHPFVSIEDFIIRYIEYYGETINRKDAENLVHAGCFDCFAKNRREVLGKFEKITTMKVRTPEKIHAVCAEPLVQEEDKAFNREQEARLLGTIVSDDPLKKYKDPSAYGCIKHEELSSGQNASLMGLVVGIEEKKSAKGNDMIVIRLLGKSESFDVIVMNQAYQRYKKNISRFMSKVIKVSGRVQDTAFFVNLIRLLPSKLDGYYLVLDSLDKTKQVTRIMRERETGPYRLTIEFHYDSHGNEMPLTVATYSVTEELLHEVMARKVLGTGKM